MNGFAVLDREWWIGILIACSAMLIIVAIGAADRFDLFYYDFIQRSLFLEPDGRILLVVIDDRSLEEFGEWPWPRDITARLVARIGKAHPRAVALDMLLFNKGSGPDDQALAQAIRGSRPVFLPVHFNVPGGNGSPFTVAEPLKQFKDAANGLGNVNLTPDGDGLIRRAYLNYTDGQLSWPSLALQLAGRSLTQNSTFAVMHPARFAGNDGFLHGQQPVLINYVGPAGSFPSVSAGSVLRGEVPDEFLRGRLILVGATASGLGDVHATPVGRDGSLMQGVEVQANLLNTLLKNQPVIPAQKAAVYAFSLIPLVGMLFLLGFGRVYETLAALIGLLFGIIIVSAGLLRFDALWLPPGSAILGIVLIYPLWTWHKLAVTVEYFSVELGRSESELGFLKRPAPELHNSDFLDRQMALLRLANNRERDLRRFLVDRITQMPDNVVVVDLAGDVVIANLGASKLFDELGGGELTGHVDNLLHHFIRQKSNGKGEITFSAVARLSSLPWSCQAETNDGKYYHAHFEPQRSSDESLVGYVIRIVDISQQIVIQRQREDILQLLTHDMRAPQASIITLLDSLDMVAMGENTVTRIRNYANRTLKLADDFVHLARAQALKFTFHDIDIAEIIRDAIDALWPQAQSRKVVVAQSVRDEQCLVRGEGSLLSRMLINMIDNAIKYSDLGGRIFIELETIRIADAFFARFSITNQGQEISPDHMAILYERFERSSSGPAAGVGLGLAFVHSVVVRHQGTIQCESTGGGKTCFTVTLPLGGDAG